MKKPKKWRAEVWTETMFGTGRTVWTGLFRWMWVAYLAVRFRAWFADHFEIPKHYGWQEVWTSHGIRWEYDYTPVGIGIYWGIKRLP